MEKRKSQRKMNKRLTFPYPHNDDLCKNVLHWGEKKIEDDMFRTLLQKMKWNNNNKNESKVVIWTL